MHYLTQIIEFYIFLNTVCFIDFTSFSDVLYLQNKVVISRLNFMSYIYIMFYFVLVLLTTFYILVFRYFYTYAYISQLHTDYVITNRCIDLNNFSTLHIYVLENTYIFNYILCLYSHLTIVNINCLIMQSMLFIFYTFTMFYYMHKNVVNLQILKINKYLYQLNINYVVLFYKNVFSTVLFIYLFIYIIFIINFLGIFIKDFSYITINVNTLVLNLLFNIKLLNLNNVVLH